MYSVNHMVMHQNLGVCQIIDIRQEEFAFSEKQWYDVLRPYYEGKNSLSYVPVNSEKVKLRKLLSVPEIYNELDQLTQKDSSWIENDKERQDCFVRILRDGDPTQVIQMIRNIHKKQEERSLAGKKLRAADEKILHDAERLLHQEFAYVLDIQLDEVIPFIMKKIQPGESKVEKESV